MPAASAAALAPALFDRDHARDVVHLNVSHFRTTVACLRDNSLKDRPLAMAFSENPRAYVLDMSPEAHRQGVRRGMTLEGARRRCRDLRTAIPEPEREQALMGELIQAAARFTPRVESAGAGHLVLDVSGTKRLFGPPADVALYLRRGLHRRLGLMCAAGLASNRVVSKAACRLVQPAGQMLVPVGTERDFLAPMPIHLLPGAGNITVNKLQGFNIRTIGQLAALPRAEVAVILGRQGAELHRRACGQDALPVAPLGAPAPQAQQGFDLDTPSVDVPWLQRILRFLIDRVGEQLRRLDLGAGRLSLTAFYQDGLQRVFRVDPPVPSHESDALEVCAAPLLEKVIDRRVRIRRLELQAARLASPDPQLDLFHADQSARRALWQAFDRVRRRFGPTAIHWGQPMSAAAGNS